MARVKKEDRRNQELIFSNDVYQFKKGRKKPVIRKDIKVLGKVRLDTPVALLEMNGRRDVFKDNLTSITDKAMTDLFKVIDDNNKLPVKQRKKYVYLVRK